MQFANCLSAQLESAVDRWESLCAVDFSVAASLVIAVDR